jgi:putative transposase
LRANKGMSIYAYCLMPDHLHLLLRLGPESGVLGNIIGKLKLFTTRASWQYGYTGKLWQDRFYDHVLRKSEDGARIAAYIWENPVRKGLVSEASGYLYSGFLDPM